MHFVWFLSIFVSVRGTEFLAEVEQLCEKTLPVVNEFSEIVETMVKVKARENSASFRLSVNLIVDKIFPYVTYIESWRDRLRVACNDEIQNMVRGMVEILDSMLGNIEEMAGDTEYEFERNSLSKQVITLYIALIPQLEDWKALGSRVESFNDVTFVWDHKKISFLQIEAESDTIFDRTLKSFKRFSKYIKVQEVVSESRNYAENIKCVIHKLSLILTPIFDRCIMFVDRTDHAPADEGGRSFDHISFLMQQFGMMVDTIVDEIDAVGEIGNIINTPLWSALNKCKIESIELKNLWFQSHAKRFFFKMMSLLEHDFQAKRQKRELLEKINSALKKVQQEATEVGAQLPPGIERDNWNRIESIINDIVSNKETLRQSDLPIRIRV